MININCKSHSIPFVVFIFSAHPSNKSKIRKVLFELESKHPKIQIRIHLHIVLTIASLLNLFKVIIINRQLLLELWTRGVLPEEDHFLTFLKSFSDPQFSHKLCNVPSNVFEKDEKLIRKTFKAVFNVTFSQ
jgi:hypothetical protein